MSKARCRQTEQRVLTTIPANMPLSQAEEIIETLIERALRAKQALDRNPEMKKRAEHPQSEFARFLRRMRLRKERNSFLLRS